MALPIADLINQRMSALGLDRTRIGLRLGYTNPIKAAGRVQALCDGFIKNRKSLRALERLPSALDVRPQDVEQAIAATRAIFAERERLRQEHVRRAEEEAEAEYRAFFEPHGFLHTRETRPSSLTMFGLSGGEERWLVIPLDLTRSPITFAAQAKEGIADVAKRGDTGHFYVPFLGRVLGYYVNYTPDNAVRYDLDGRPVEALERAFRLGRVSVRIGN